MDSIWFDICFFYLSSKLHLLTIKWRAWSFSFDHQTNVTPLLISLQVTTATSSTPYSHESPSYVHHSRNTLHDPVVQSHASYRTRPLIHLSIYALTWANRKPSGVQFDGNTPNRCPRIQHHTHALLSLDCDECGEPPVKCVRRQTRQLQTNRQHMCADRRDGA